MACLIRMCDGNAGLPVKLIRNEGGVHLLRLKLQVLASRCSPIQALHRPCSLCACSLHGHAIVRHTLTQPGTTCVLLRQEVSPLSIMQVPAAVQQTGFCSKGSMPICGYTAYSGRCEKP